MRVSFALMAGHGGMIVMAGRNRHTPEQIVRKLRQAQELAARGVDVAEIARQLGISVPTYYAWRKKIRRHVH